MRVYGASDLKLDLAAFPDRSFRPGWIFIGGLRAWRMTDHVAALLHKAPCPICEGRPLPRNGYCLGCDRSGLDGRVTFPGLRVDEAPDPTWAATTTAYRPDDGLVGGMAGGRVGKRKKSKVRRAG